MNIGGSRAGSLPRSSENEGRPQAPFAVVVGSGSYGVGSAYVPP